VNHDSFAQRLHWRLSAYYFAYFAFLGAFSSYYGIYLQGLGLSAWRISVVISLIQIMRVLAPNGWGWLAVRLGKKAAVVQLSAVASLAIFTLLFFVDSFFALVVVTALLGLFWSASLPLVEAITLSQLQGKAEHYGRIRVWGSIGFVAAVLGTGALLDRFPLSALLWISAVLLVSVCIGAFQLADSPAPIERPRLAPIGATLSRPEVRAVLLAAFFMAFAHAPYYVFYSIHLVAHGYSKTMVGTLWSLGVVAEIGVFILMPRLLRKYAPRPIFLATFAAAAVRFLVIGWGTDSLSLLLLAQLLHAATFGAFHATAVAALNRWFAGQHQARVQALYGSVSFGAGGMIGGLLAGQIWDSLGPSITFSAAACAALVGGWLIWRFVPAELVRAH
jgi:PPP family 3-phenylpropionic acid transporter